MIARAFRRIYLPPLPRRVWLLEGAGLCVQKVWGDFDETPAGPDSPRLIVLARKTEKPS